MIPIPQSLNLAPAMRHKSGPCHDTTKATVILSLHMPSPSLRASTKLSLSCAKLSTLPYTSIQSLGKFTEVSEVAATPNVMIGFRHVLLNRVGSLQLQA